MNIAWLLEDTEISDRNRAVLALADAMSTRGHRVRLVTTESAPTWRHSIAEWVYVDELTHYASDDRECIVATSLSTVELARRIGGRRSAWYCFGDDDAAEVVRIEAASQIAILAAAEPLVSRYAGVTKDIAVLGVIVDDDVYRLGAPREREQPRVLLSGPSQEEARGIHDGYGAVAHARWFHQKLDLIRASPWAPSREEPLDSVQEFHVALSTSETTRLIHSCDVVIVPNETEAFSLAPMEALAAGIPSIFTSLPSLLAFDARRDYALFAPAGNAVEMGERLIELLEGHEVRCQLSERAREVAEQWRAPKIADKLERFLAGRSE